MIRCACSRPIFTTVLETYSYDLTLLSPYVVVQLSIWWNEGQDVDISKLLFIILNNFLNLPNCIVLRVCDTPVTQSVELQKLNQLMTFCLLFIVQRHINTVRAVNGKNGVTFSDINKDWTLKVKAKTKDFTETCKRTLQGLHVCTIYIFKADRSVIRSQLKFLLK